MSHNRRSPNSHRDCWPLSVTSCLTDDALQDDGEGGTFASNGFLDHVGQTSDYAIGSLDITELVAVQHNGKLWFVEQPLNSR